MSGNQKKILLITVTAAALWMLALWGEKKEPVTKTAFILNTFVTVTIYDKTDMALVEESLQLCRDYENLFSRTIESSEVYRLNHREAGEQSVSVSDDTAKLLGKGLEYSRISGGDFDITVEPLTSLWNFTDGKKEIPSEAKISEAVDKVGFENMKVNREGKIVEFFSPETSVDLGAIAKGYIADRMKDYLKQKGVKSAVLNLGGNILCIGQRPDGTPFKIGLQKPFEERNEVAATLDINDMSVVSSGVYERNFVVDGVNYHHILDPKTGYPYENGLVSVTIISRDSVDGDGLSTTCFSLGLQKGMELIDSMEEVYAVFITEDYELHFSQGASELLSK